MGEIMFKRSGMSMNMVEKQEHHEKIWSQTANLHQR